MTWRTSSSWLGADLRSLSLFFTFVTSVNSVDALKMQEPVFPGVIYCLENRMVVQFPKDFNSMKTAMMDSFGHELLDCTYVLDLEKSILIAPYDTCTKKVSFPTLGSLVLHSFKSGICHHRNLQTQPVDGHMQPMLDQYRMIIRFTESNAPLKEGNVYHFSCPAVHDISKHEGTTNCTKEHMSTSFQVFSELDDENPAPHIPLGWSIVLNHSLSLSISEAMARGYNVLFDMNKVIVQVSLNATGLIHYTQDHSHLYMMPVTLQHSAHGQTTAFSSKMICVLDATTCNSTHMTITIPEFPGKLTSLRFHKKKFSKSQLPQNGIDVEEKDGLRLHFKKSLLKTKFPEKCLSYQLYISSLKLFFSFQLDHAAMVIYPECDCETSISIVTGELCTLDGFMDVAVYSNHTKSVLDLNTLTVGNSSCRPIFKSPSKKVVRFNIPLNGCGTRSKSKGDKVIYENEIHARWTEHPRKSLSRDSEFRMTVTCSYNKNDMVLRTTVKFPLPKASMKLGSLSLSLKTYPDKSYLEPYGEKEYPVMKHLHQPIYLEVKILNRTDPDIKLVLDDCWASPTKDPTSHPQWNIVMDGCVYNMDKHKTTFHPVDSSVNYPNHYQRFDVTTYSFVSEIQKVSTMVFFHCSASVCRELSPDSPLCSVTCPESPRRRREVKHKLHLSAKRTTDEKMIVSLPGPILLAADDSSSEGPEDTEDRAVRVVTFVLSAVGLVITVVVTAILVVTVFLSCYLYKNGTIGFDDKIGL